MEKAFSSLRCLIRLLWLLAGREVDTPDLHLALRRERLAIWLYGRGNLGGSALLGYRLRPDTRAKQSVGVAGLIRFAARLLGSGNRLDFVDRN